MHYNTDDPEAADLHTYMANPHVFDIKEGHIDALQGMSYLYLVTVYLIVQARASA